MLKHAMAFVRRVTLNLCVIPPPSG